MARDLRRFLGLIPVLAFTSVGCNQSPTPDDFAELTAPVLGDCTVSSVVATLQAPYEPGSVTLSAVGTCGGFGAVEYQFWAKYPGATWTAPCGGYSASASCQLSGLLTGDYRFQVWAKHAATAPSSFDAKRNTSPLITTILPTPAWSPCTSPTVSVSPVGHLFQGDQITVSGTASCGGGTATFRPAYRRAAEPFTDSNTNGSWDVGESFTDRDTSGTYDVAGTWTLLSTTWSTSPFVWSATSVPGEFVEFRAEVRGDPAGAVVNSAASSAVQITAGSPGICTANSLTADPTPAAVGETITMTANASCTNDADADYYFNVKVAGVWTTICNWQAGNTCTWVPNAAGTYRTSFWVRRHGSTSNVAESQRAMDVAVGEYGSCSSVGTTIYPATYAVIGDNVTLSHTSSCDPGILATYRTSWKIGAGAWNTICDWTATTACTWPTGSLAAGIYDVRVEARGALSGTVAETIVSYELQTASGTCSVTSGPSAVPDPGVLATSGGISPLVTSSVTCGTNIRPEYDYWVRNPANQWTHLCTWIPTPDCTGTWVPTSTGLHRLQVSLRRQGTTTVLATVNTDYPVLCDPSEPTCLVQMLKASNAEAEDRSGRAVAIDGDTLVVGAREEDSSATGVGGSQTDNSVADSGAVYVYVRTNGVWAQQAYIKPSNTGAGDLFGTSVAISGNTLVVGASAEDSSATGAGGDQSDNSAVDSGAVYVFTRSGTVWTQRAYVKASNTGAGDLFGHRIGLSGNTLVVTAPFEDSAASGVNGNGADNSLADSGAVYVFTGTGSTWTQQAYIKASNPDSLDQFGWSAAVDANTIVVGANFEQGASVGVGGNEADNTASRAGAAYVFFRSGAVWSQEAYLKASNTGAQDRFGNSVDVSGDVVVVSAPLEDSNATGVNGDSANNSVLQSGAAYVYRRSGVIWSQEAYLKASTVEQEDRFGWDVAIDGSNIVLGAYLEDSNAVGVDGLQTDNSAASSGAAFVFSYNGTTWAQQHYVKAGNTTAGDQFGQVVAVSGTLVIAGSLFQDTTASNSGAAYAFDLSL